MSKDFNMRSNNYLAGYECYSYQLDCDCSLKLDSGLTGLGSKRDDKSGGERTIHCISVENFEVSIKIETRQN